MRWILKWFRRGDWLSDEERARLVRRTEALSAQNEEAYRVLWEQKVEAERQAADRADIQAQLEWLRTGRKRGRQP